MRQQCASDRDLEAARPPDPQTETTGVNRRIINLQDEHGKPRNGQRAGELGRATTHGARSDLLIAPRAAELRDHLAGLIPAHTDSDAPAVTLLAWQLARIERANVWLDEHGLLDGAGVPRPVLRVLSTWENSASRLCDALGLTPTSRARLGLDLSRAEAVQAERLRSAEGAGARALARIEGEAT